MIFLILGLLIVILVIFMILHCEERKILKVYKDRVDAICTADLDIGDRIVHYFTYRYNDKTYNSYLRIKSCVKIRPNAGYCININPNKPEDFYVSKKYNR